MKKNKKLEKFSYGYTNKRKAVLLSQVLLFVGIAMIIFIVGLLLNKFSVTNIFTIVAMLFVLPMARYLTVLLVVLPYKTPKKELYERLVEAVKDNGLILSDIIFSSTETTMELDFIVLNGGEAYLYAPMPKNDKEKNKQKKAEEFINAHFKTTEYSVKAKLYNNFDEFVKKATMRTISSEEELELLKKERESMEYFII